MEFLIKPLVEISLSTFVLKNQFQNLRRSHLCWKQMGKRLPQRQLRNVELVQPLSRKFYCKGSTKSSKRIFGEHATEPS